MKTLPLIQQSTLSAISKGSKKSLPSIAINALLLKGLIVSENPCEGGYALTDDGERALKNAS